MAAHTVKKTGRESQVHTPAPESPKTPGGHSDSSRFHSAQSSPRVPSITPPSRSSGRLSIDGRLKKVELKLQKHIRPPAEEAKQGWIPWLLGRKAPEENFKPKPPEFITNAAEKAKAITTAASEDPKTQRKALADYIAFLDKALDKVTTEEKDEAYNERYATEILTEMSRAYEQLLKTGVSSGSTTELLTREDSTRASSDESSRRTSESEQVTYANFGEPIEGDEPEDDPEFVGMSQIWHSARSSFQEEPSAEEKLKPILTKIAAIPKPGFWARLFGPKEKKELVFKHNKKLVTAIQYTGVPTYERLTNSEERRESLLDYLVFLNMCHDQAVKNHEKYGRNIEGILNEMKRAYEEYQAIPHDPAQNRNTNIRRSNLLHLSVINNKEVSLQFLSNLREASTPEQAKTIEKFIAEIQDSDRNDLNSLAEFINLYLADGWIKPPNRLEDVVKLFNSLQFQAVIKAVLETTPEEAEQNRQERVANFEFMPEVQEAILTGNQVYRLGYQISERLKEGRLRQNQFDIELDAQENAYASILGQDSLQDTTKENLSQIDSEIKKTNSSIQYLNQIKNEITNKNSETLANKEATLKQDIEKLKQIKERTQQEQNLLESLGEILEAITKRNTAEIVTELKKHEEYLKFLEKQKEQLENGNIEHRLQKLKKDEQELEAALKSLKDNEIKIKQEIEKIDKLLLQHQHQPGGTEEQKSSINRKRTALGNTLEQLRLRLRETDGIPKEIDTLERSINLVRRMRRTTVLKAAIEQKSATQRLINKRQKELVAIQKSLDHPKKRDPTEDEAKGFGKVNQIPHYAELEDLKKNRETILADLRKRAKNLDTLFEQELLRLQDQDADKENGKIPIDYWTPWLLDIGRDATGLGESTRRLGQEKDTILVREKLLADQGVTMQEAYQELGKSLTRIFNITDPKMQLKELARLSRLPKWILDNPNLAREMIGNIQLALSEIYASKEGDSFKKIKEYIITDGWVQDILAASREAEDDSMSADCLAFLHITGYMPILIAAHRAENTYLGNMFGSVAGGAGRKVGDLIQGAFTGIVTKATAQGLARAYPGLGSLIESFESLTADNDPLEVSKTFVKRSAFAEATRLFRNIKELGFRKAMQEVAENLNSWRKHASAGEMAVRSVSELGPIAVGSWLVATTSWTGIGFGLGIGCIAFGLSMRWVNEHLFFKGTTDKVNADMLQRRRDAKRMTDDEVNDKGVVTKKGNYTEFLDAAAAVPA